MSDDAFSPTPRTPRAEVRERLLVAGADVFAESGVHGARLDDVAARGQATGRLARNACAKVPSSR